MRTLLAIVGLLLCMPARPDYVLSGCPAPFADKEYQPGKVPPADAEQKYYPLPTDMNALKSNTGDLCSQLRAALERLAGAESAISALQGGVSPSPAPTQPASSPTSGQIGTPVTLTGQYYTGTSSVTLGGVSASFTVSPGGTQILTTVPAGATSGSWVVTTSVGASPASPTFTVIPTGSCTIASVTGSPATAVAGGSPVQLSATATETPTGCTIDKTVICYSAPSCGSVTSSCLFTPPTFVPATGICTVQAASASVPAKGTLFNIPISPFTAVSGNDITVAASQSASATAGVTSPTGSVDYLDWTADDATTSTWRFNTDGARPTCSAGGTTCGTLANAICGGTPKVCSVTYTAPVCAAPPCSFRLRGTSHLDPTSAGDYLVVTVTGAASALALSPTSSSATAGGGTVAFTASGGTAPYTWSISTNNSGGTVSPSSGSSTTYTAGGTSGVTDTVRVTDSVAATANASVTINAPSALGAFPGCQGSGCQTRGGFASGSTVYHVTSLASGTGAGTLGACIAASGPRVCLFDVAGTIASSGYTIGNGQLTIDGRSAPGGGIQITQQDPASNIAVFWPRANDIVIRGLKIRPGRNPEYAGDLSGVCGVNMIGTSVARTIFDHNSIEWANGDQISMWGSSGVTMDQITYSWNIIGEGLDLALKGQPAVGSSHNINMGGTTGTTAAAVTNVDYHHNYLVDNTERGMRYKTKGGRLVNNVIYNSQDPIQYAGGVAADTIGNVAKVGPWNTESPVWWYGGPVQLWYQGQGSDNDWTSGTASHYATGNTDSQHPGDTGTTNWTSGLALTCDIAGNCSSSTTYQRTSPLSTASSGIAIVADAASSVVGTPGVNTGTPTGTGVLGNVGAVQRLDCGGNLVMRRDALDSRLVNAYAAGTGPAHVPFDETDTAELGFPTIAAVSTTCASNALDNATCKCADTDSDGLPDYFEHAWTTSDTGMSATGHSLDANFTDLEMYLSGQKGKTSY